METKIIDNYEEFSGIKKEWDVLLTNSRANLLFLTFEWLSAWWKYYGQGNKLLIILVIDRGKIMAAAPLMIKAVRKGRFIIGNKLQFIAHENSDYMDFIISEQDEECFKLIFGEILSRQKEWDWLDFIFIPENSPHIELWKKYALKTRCLNKNMREISESASLNLRGKYDSLIDFEKSLSNKRRNDLKRCSRLLHKEGAVSYFRTGKITDTEALFSRFVGCHKKRWTKNRKKSIFDEY
ncbi:MAG: hypothetical protein NTU54_01250, partial [Candidatus Omnitrophica bacterium]|nr:hypothetical protein [Candidatus Omnitrophota bacterium]